MFAYLSKKLEMSSGANVRCLAWSPTNNYLACGCDNGLLKVLKIDTYKSNQSEDESQSGAIPSVGYLASPSNILLNQTLEGHSCPIQVIAWNNVHNKLTTSDSRGLIVVWMLYKGSWYEEMVNNRNKSTVRGLAWSSDGEKICIVYEDGGVIVGSLDGNRLWSKELRGPQLTGVCWSPNCASLLFSHSTGEIHVYDAEGTFVSKLAIDSGSRSREDVDAITTVCWHNSEETQDVGHTLAVVFRENMICLLNGIYDSCPIVVNTGLLATCGDWSPNGFFLAIGGTPFNSPEGTSKVRIFGSKANFLYELNLPLKGIVDLAWDSWNLRLAIGVGTNVFFANIRPFYKACFYGGFMYVYLYTKPNGATTLAFWDQEKLTHQEIPGRAIEIKGNRDVCAILTELNHTCTIAITNVQGNVIDSIKLESIQPFTIALTENLVVAVAKNGVMLWKYHKVSGKNVGKTDQGIHHDRVFHIDDESTSSNPDLPGHTLKATKDPCVCADAKENGLVIGRESGTLHVYSLPHGTLLHIMTTMEGVSTVKRIFLNTDGSQLAMLDSNGSLSTCHLAIQSRPITKQYEKKDIWDLIWAKDNPNLFCIMEKTRLYIIMNGEMQDPIVSSGYLLNFVDLEVTSILLDELMRDPDAPSSQLIVKHEARSLRDTRALLKSDTSVEDIFKYVELNGHPILWQMLARKALYTMNFKIAETSFVRCRDYCGVQFTKRVAVLAKPLVQMAEISSFYSDFRSAESYYCQAGRKDLVMEMWTLLGKWQCVDIENLREVRGELSEDEMRNVYMEIGDAFAENGDWASAKPFYKLSKFPRKMFECCLILEDYIGLGSLTSQLPNDSELFDKIGNVLSSVGLCEMAVHAYVSGGLFEEAVECCIFLNRWNLAMELAQDYNLPSSGRVMVMYASHLIGQDEIMQAIDLFKSCSRPFYGAVIAVMLALKFLEYDEFNVMLVRKLFSLAAVLVKPSSQLIPEQLQPQASLDELFEFYMPSDLVPPVDVVDWIQCDSWRGVNAINCFIAVQRKIYTKEYREAIRRGVYLLEYVDILGEERVGCIIGLTAANCEAFHVASQAFMLLEAFDPSYSKISSQLFSDLDPVDLVDIGAHGEDVDIDDDSMRPRT